MALIIQQVYHCPFLLSRASVVQIHTRIRTQLNYVRDFSVSYSRLLSSHCSNGGLPSIFLIISLILLTYFPCVNENI